MDTTRLFRCLVCDSVVEAISYNGMGICCCGRDMMPMWEQTAGRGKSIHLPVITPVEGGLRVRVGEQPHPMDADHRIEWIELVTEGRVRRQYLLPGSMSEAVFKIVAGPEDVAVRAFCSVHGVWRAGQADRSTWPSDLLAATG